MQAISRLIPHLLGLVAFLISFLLGITPYACSLLLGGPAVDPGSVLPILQNIREYTSTDGCKPNPLLLELYINEYGALRLNSEAVGTIHSTLPLRIHLNRIFRLRTENRVYNERGKIEKSVLIVPGTGISGFDILEVVSALEDVGAGPIFVDWNGEATRFYYCSKGIQTYNGYCRLDGRSSHLRRPFAHVNP